MATIKRAFDVVVPSSDMAGRHDDADRPAAHVGARAAAMRRINDAWLGRHADDLAAMVHPEIVMVFPGFAGRAQGLEGFLAGFRDFCDNAHVHEFRQDDQQIDVIGETAA